MIKRNRTAVSPTMNVDEAAKMLGIGRNTAYEAAQRNELPVIRISGRILVVRAKLEEMLNGKSTATTAIESHEADRLRLALTKLRADVLNLVRQIDHELKGTTP